MGVGCYEVPSGPSVAAHIDCAGVAHLAATGILLMLGLGRVGRQ